MAYEQIKIKEPALAQRVVAFVAKEQAKQTRLHSHEGALEPQVTHSGLTQGDHVVRDDRGAAPARPRGDAADSSDVNIGLAGRRVPEVGEISGLSDASLQALTGAAGTAKTVGLWRQPNRP